MTNRQDTSYLCPPQNFGGRLQLKKFFLRSFFTSFFANSVRNLLFLNTSVFEKHFSEDVVDIFTIFK